MREGAAPLAIEPLHPMQGAGRSYVNTLSYALDNRDAVDPGRIGARRGSDVYHTWSDPQLETQIGRAGRGRLLTFHVLTGWCRAAIWRTFAG
jgi:hypothetical protein